MLEEFARILPKKATNTLVVTHKKPDGDAICSVIAIKLALEQLGHKNVDANIPNCPEDFDFLPESKNINGGLKQEYDYVVIVDTPDLKRVDTEVDITKSCMIVIDHHETKDKFGDLKYVNPSAAATCEILFYLFQELEVPITKDIAECLYAGILSDTDLLTTRIKTKRIFEVLSKLFPQVNHNELVGKLSKVTVKQFRQKSNITENAKIFKDKDCIISFISDELLTEEEKKGKINSKLLMCDLQKLEFEIKILLIPTINGIKISFRSSKKDLLYLSEFFGGGGHKTSCGATLILKDGFYITNQGKKICRGNRKELINKIVEFIN